jgi:8-oxo-dGTP diphosphatase
MAEDYPRIDVTVDVVALAHVGGEPQVLVVRRGNPPFEGQWALPGGYLEVDEDLATSAARELREETGVDLPAERLRQLGAYGDPDRDPRNRTVSVAFVAQLDEPALARGGSDAADARWLPVADLTREDGTGDQNLELAFDHAQILRDAVARTASVPSPHADPG